MAVTSPVTASTPTLTWQGAERVAVLCNFAGGSDGDAAGLCRQVAGLAARGAPLPVGAVSWGDPALVSPKAVVLLVHASIEGTGGARRLLLTVRAMRPGAAEEMLFGAAPRAAALPSGDLDTPAVRAALEATLDETLPWRGGPAPRPIR